MLVEIFISEDGAILMTSVFGVPKSWAKAFFAQGAYAYEFRELPEAIVDGQEVNSGRLGLTPDRPRSGVWARLLAKIALRQQAELIAELTSVH